MPTESFSRMRLPFESPGLFALARDDGTGIASTWRPIRGQWLSDEFETACLKSTPGARDLGKGPPAGTGGKSPWPINLNGFTLVGPILAQRAITGNTMARTRALRIGCDPLAASSPHRIGAHRIARSDQEPQPLRSRPAARARPSHLGQGVHHPRT